jgi:hypothetical protein
MLRRITAFLTIVLLVGLVLLLAWRVYLHHENAGGGDQPEVVSVRSRAA